jgi:hypothetical protein
MKNLISINISYGRCVVSKQNLPAHYGTVVRHESEILNIFETSFFV